MTSTANDFAADVMATLIKRKVTLRGLHPKYLEINLDGSIKIWFAGNNERKAITILNEPSIHMADSNVISEVCEKIIDSNNARYY
jgi:hypothetical protein